MTGYVDVSEDEIVETILFHGFRADVLAGERPRAREEARALLDRLVCAGLHVRTGPDGGRAFDPVETLNLASERALRGDDPFWHTHVVEPKRRDAERFFPTRPPVERHHDPRRVTLRARREIPFHDRRPGARMIVTLPVPALGPAQRDISVVCSAPEGAHVENGMIVARTVVPPDGCITVETTISLTAWQTTVNVDPARLEAPSPGDPDVAENLSRDDGLVRITPAIEALARRLAHESPWETLTAYWDFFFAELKLGAIRHDALDASDPLGSALASGWVDCLLGSAILVAVARTLGIPARVVHGLLVYPRSDVCSHYWSEAFLPPYGWVPFDLHGWVLAGGDARDERWRRLLVGHLPYQVVLPKAGRELGVRYPRRWFLLSTIAGEGQENGVFDADTGAVVVSDRWEATIGDA